MTDLEAVGIIDKLMTVIVQNRLTDENGAPLAGHRLDDVREISATAMEYLMRGRREHSELVTHAPGLWRALADRGLIT